jgi:hypothetical protein
MSSKKKAQKIHAKRRVMERYNLSLKNKDLYSIGQKIIKGESCFKRKINNRLKVHEVEYGGQILKVVYDSIRHTVVTFLNENME